MAECSSCSDMICALIPLRQGNAYGNSTVSQDLAVSAPSSAWSLVWTRRKVLFGSRRVWPFGLGADASAKNTEGIPFNLVHAGEID